MGKSISAIFGSLLFSIFLLSGCANKDVALTAYENKDYEKAFAIWKQWADAGYANANIKIATSTLPQKISSNNDLIIKQLQQAYNNGSKKAPLLLEDLYIKQHNYTKAYQWFLKADLKLSNDHDVQNHLLLITSYLKTFTQQKEALQKLEEALKTNPYIAYRLGEFYAQKGIFYNLKKSLNLLSYAYAHNIQKAGIQKALILLYKLNKEEEALSLLYEIAKSQNSQAFLEIGKFLYHKKNQILDKYNQPCISCSFQNNYDFHIKKEKLYKIKEMYIKNNVIPWFKNAYQLGNEKGILFLIQLDLDNNNFKSHKQTYSTMDLNQTISYLQSISSQYEKANMLLAQIYTKYLFLHKKELAKQIYLHHLCVDPLNALWHLYLYEKKFNPNSKEQQNYLQKLLAQGFEPAKVEQAYLNILAQKQLTMSLRILQNAAKQKDINALRYLAQLQIKHHLRFKKTPCDLYRTICHIEPMNITNDLDIANYYLNNNDITKAAIIFQYYAQKQNPKAQLALAKIYELYCDDKKYFHYLEKVKKQGDQEVTFLFDKLILLGYKKTNNLKHSIQRVKHLADRGDPKAIELLAQAYSLGITLPYQPKKALYYYKQLEKYSLQESLKNQLKIYQQINIKGIYNHMIDNLYTQLIHIDEKEKINYATYLISEQKIDKAKGILLSLQKYKDDQVNYLLYKITNDPSYLYGAENSNNGNLLLEYSKLIASSKPYTALVYAFRSALCNTRSTGETIYKLMLQINNSTEILKLYNEAKQYPKCISY